MAAATGATFNYTRGLDLQDEWDVASDDDSSTSDDLRTTSTTTNTTDNPYDFDWSPSQSDKVPSSVLPSQQTHATIFLNDDES